MIRATFWALGQRLDPDEQQVAQGVGEAGAAAFVRRHRELLDEEGVAVGAFEDVVDLGGVGFGGEDAGDLTADLVTGEAGEFEALDGAQPVEFGEQGAQRMTAVDVVGAVGGEDDETAGAQGAQQIGQQMAGGGVGPVQVLQGDHDRALGGNVFQEAGGEFEEAGHALLVVASSGGRLPQFGQQPGEFLLLAGRGGGQFVRQGPAQGAQCGGERGERQSVGADLDTAAERDDGAPAVGGGGELLDESGLADPGLTADEQRLWLSRGGAGERVVQGVQLVGSTDEDGADGPGLHGGEHRTRVGGRPSGYRRGSGGRAADPRAAALPRPRVHAGRANRSRSRRWVCDSLPAPPSARSAARSAASRRAARRPRTTSRASRSCSARRRSSAERAC